jgi:hypothetical protein
VRRVLLRDVAVTGEGFGKRRCEGRAVWAKRRCEVRRVLLRDVAVTGEGFGIR